MASGNRIGWYIGFLSLLVANVLAPAQATPWADSDDLQVRHNLQILADAGVVNLSVSTYPLMWGALLEVLNDVDIRSLREHERNAYLQVMAVMNFHRQGGYTGGQISGQSNNGAERGFGQRQHEKGALEITQELKSEHSAFRLQMAWRTGLETRFGRKDKQDLSFAGTYLATVVTTETFGSWVLSVDQLYTWWSPSYENDGMHTRSTRPLQSLRITRAGAAPSNLPILSWLGPWSATAYVGRSERLIGVPDLLQQGDAELIADAYANSTYLGSLVPGHREEAFGIRVTANPYKNLQLGARFTGSHLEGANAISGRATPKNAAIDARFVVPSYLNLFDANGQLALYGELITHQSSNDETFHTLGADYSFAFGANTQGSSNQGSRITNARVYAEHLVHQQKETLALGYSQFTNSGFGIDVRLRSINYEPGYYQSMYFHEPHVQGMLADLVSQQRFGEFFAHTAKRQQADVSVYLPFRSGRLTAGVQAWEDTYRNNRNESDINLFLNWEIRW
ncbi:hypothetical protein CWE13_04955 [Aliidiomarina shirensis]|uniref:Capsule assembly Wzi family protein n=1 Tax=Aliidiomarina shirensis TaxID=1048642 RepID=A0A432WU74_9GAMM|nr:capsule assembly Wzi family protein [Aliidiomarina shirensis]RUO37315.1 hypothetical protein CWE13_04955 [Aliidiomarina shirensis]